MKNFGKIISDKDIITKEYLDSKGYISAITSKMVTDALGFTPFDSAAFTKTSIKNALGIADWALAANKPSYDDVYLKLAGGTITGNLKVIGGFRAESQYGHYINFDGFSLTANAGLKVVSGYSLSLAGESITSWAGLKNYLSFAFSDIGSKPTTLSGYGITDSVSVGGPETSGNADDILTSSIVGYTENLTNTPYNYATLITFVSKPYNYASQIAISHAGRVSVRGWDNPWNSWYEVLTTLNINNYTYTKELIDATFSKLADTMSIRSEGSSVDFNDLTAPGAYTITGGTNSHHPLSYGTLLTIHGKSDYFMSQIAIFYNGETFIRGKGDTLGDDGDYWYEWRTVVDSVNIGDYAISKAGGTITGNLTVTGTVNAYGLLSSDVGLKIGGQTIAKWSDVANYLSFIDKDTFLMPTNSFDYAGHLEASYAANALYAADKRFSVSGSGFTHFDASQLFDNRYEGEYFARVDTGATATMTISNYGNNIIEGYPYGDIYLSFYYNCVPADVQVEVYCNNASQGIGWHTLTLKSKRGHFNGVWCYNNSYYGVTQLRITITASASIVAALTEIDWHLSRAALSNLPIVTKFGIDQELWGRLICQGGITLNGTTITSWDDLKASGDYLPLTGGTITGNLTLYGEYALMGDIPTGGIYPRFRMFMHSSGLFFQAATYDGTSQAGKIGFTGYGGVAANDIYFNATTIRFLGASSFNNALTVSGLLTANGGITLGGETITSWDDVGATPTKSQTATSGTVSIAPNVLNKWSSALTGTLTITFASGTSGVANYYMLEFTTGSSIPTINLPSGVKWEGGYNILNNLAANTTYQISILNNLAVGGAF